MSFFNRKPQGEIRRRVLAVVEERIADAEAHFQEGMTEFDREYMESCSAALNVRNDKRERLADNLVDSVLGGSTITR